MPQASFEENLFQDRKAKASIFFFSFFFLSAFSVLRVVLGNICNFVLSVFLH